MFSFIFHRYFQTVLSLSLHKQLIISSNYLLPFRNFARHNKIQRWAAFHLMTIFFFTCWMKVQSRISCWEFVTLKKLHQHYWQQQGNPLWINLGYVFKKWTRNQSWTGLLQWREPTISLSMHLLEQNTTLLSLHQKTRALRHIVSNCQFLPLPHINLLLTTS